MPVKIIPTEITDTCRKGLIKYLLKALSIIPHLEKPLILDIGCGTGVPTTALADIYAGKIYAVDSNKKSLSRLKQKIDSLNLSDRITLIHSSVFDLKFTDLRFDIVLAEGLLNIIGFENGLQIVSRYIKDDGYFVIHDEIKNHNKKLKIIERNQYKLLGSFELNEDIWWNDYYDLLERKITASSDKNIRDMFKRELDEIEMYKKNPARFRSMYYILKKQSDD
jgi:ubiquinone/menaquinone biosynthesis C-methylase UbiE